MSRTFGLDDLAIRLASGITLFVVAALALALYLAVGHHYDHTIQVRQQAAAMQNRLVEVALRHQMMEKDKKLISEVLAEIGRQPEVESAMILDHEGTVRHSSQPSQVGSRIQRTSAACLVCHAQEPVLRGRWVVLNDGPSPVLRSVLPIENRPACYACHSPSKRINGILILDVSLATLRERLDRDSRWIAAGTVGLVLLLLGGLSFLIRRLVLVRLHALGRTARTLAAGDIAVRAAVNGTDRISELARDFNHIAEETSQLAAEVRSQEEQLSNVMNALDDGLVVLDSDFRIVGCNHAFCRMMGTHREALIGRRCREVAIGVWQHCHEEGTCVAAQCMETGAHQRVRFRDDLAEGDLTRVDEVSASPIPDETGRVTRVVEVWRDISGRVREEERMAEIERLVSLGVLASGFSHEMNTPLASVLTCAESSLARLDECEAGGRPGPDLSGLRDCVETIREETLRCKRITKRFLRFSRGIPPGIEPLELRGAVTSVMQIASTTAREARVTIEIHGAEKLPMVRANTELVQHVVLNLLVNAIQSCGDRGGRIELRFRVDGKVRLLIQDTGCGIPVPDRRYLFEPFRSRKPQGTGLGLFLSRSFMRRFGGEVRLLWSGPDSGTCFEVVFLAAEEEGP